MRGYEISIDNGTPIAARRGDADLQHLARRARSHVPDRGPGDQQGRLVALGLGRRARRGASRRRPTAPRASVPVPGGVAVGDRLRHPRLGAARRRRRCRRHDRRLRDRGQRHRVPRLGHVGTTIENLVGGPSPPARVRAWNSRGLAGDWLALPPVQVVTRPAVPVRLGDAPARWTRSTSRYADGDAGGSPITERQYRIDNGGRGGRTRAGRSPVDGAVTVEYRVCNVAGCSPSAPRARRARARRPRRMHRPSRPRCVNADGTVTVSWQRRRTTTAARSTGTSGSVSTGRRGERAWPPTARRCSSTCTGRRAAPSRSEVRRDERRGLGIRGATVTVSVPTP